MRFKTILAEMVLAAVLPGAQLDSKLLKLIPQDANVVCGIDLDRYRATALTSFYPVDPWVRTFAGDGLHQLIAILQGPAQHAPELTIYVGPVGSPVGWDDGNEYRVLDDSTAILGNDLVVDEAMERWNQAELPNEALASKIKVLSDTYDAWVIAIKPFDENESPGIPINLKHRADFLQLVQEVQAGIRLGSFYDATVEITLPSPDDAYAMAAIGRWLPGFIQASQPSSKESSLADLAENITAIAKGNVASLSFSLDPIKLQELIESQRKAEKEQDSDAIQ